jgi:hypothetical protein
MGGFQNTMATLIRISDLSDTRTFHHNARIYAKGLLFSALIKISDYISQYPDKYIISFLISYIYLSLFSVIYMIWNF